MLLLVICSIPDRMEPVQYFYCIIISISLLGAICNIGTNGSQRGPGGRECRRRQEYPAGIQSATGRSLALDTLSLCVRGTVNANNKLVSSPEKGTKPSPVSQSPNS